ncbi:MAG: hypothetical protein PGN11_15170, partial [Quadrisphaera sp.]
MYFELPPSMTTSPLGQQALELVDDAVGDLAGRDHHPDRAGRGQGGDEGLEALDVAQVGVVVEAGDLDAAAAQPRAHVAAHLAETDETDVHGRPPGKGWWCWWTVS